MPGWAINLYHQLLGERERDAEPPGELRKVFPSRCTSNELSLSRSTSCLPFIHSLQVTIKLLAAFVVRKKNGRLLVWLSRTKYLPLDGHNTRDIGQGYYTDALPLRGGRCKGAVSQLCTRVATPVSS